MVIDVLEEQGYGVNTTVVYQDNQSTILLAKNGRKSSTKRTKHINVRYYFVHDRWMKNEIDIRFCPTDEMKADFLLNLL